MNAFYFSMLSELCRGVTHHGNPNQHSAPLASLQCFSCFFLFGSPHQPVAKAGFEVCFFKTVVQKKAPNMPFHSFLPSQRLLTLYCGECCSQPHYPPVPRRRQLPAPGKGCDPHSHWLTTLSYSKVEADGLCTFPTQFLSLVSVRNLPDEGQINHHLSPPTSRIFINIDSYSLIKFC